MADTDRPDSDDALQTPDPSAEEQTTEVATAEEPEKLDLRVAIEEPSACQRHITVTVGREDIEHYFDKEFTELMSSASVPGFRAGHAPRKLVETRFRKEIQDKIKSELLMDSIAQVTDDEKLSAISEPELDLDAVKLPDEGPMTFEFDLEVRPEFELPQWKGLNVERPTREFTDKDIDEHLKSLLGRYGRLVPHDGPAETGDYLTTHLTFSRGDQVLSEAKEETIRIRPVLSFRDGKIEQFDKLMEGVQAGEVREGAATLSLDAPNVALRGQEVTARFEVVEVKKLELPELDEEFLEKLGDFESEADLRDTVKDNLKRQLEYRRHQQAREQITAALTEAADWELPPEMLQRQSRRELQRAVLELRRSGFSDEEIRAYENELRQNSQASTARALKEHFILERIAEEEEIDVDENDYKNEIALIAAQSGETPRRVRARLEKGGMMDALHNQIIERKVIDRILAEAEFHDVPYVPESAQTEALDQSAGGEDEPDIPEAKPEHEEPQAAAEEPEDTDKE